MTATMSRAALDVITLNGLALVDIRQWHHLPPCNFAPLFHRPVRSVSAANLNFKINRESLSCKLGMFAGADGKVQTEVRAPPVLFGVTSFLGIHATLAT